MSDPTNPFQNRNELKDHFEIKRLRAELAAVRKQHDANGKASRDRAEHIYKLRTKLNVAEAERDELQLQIKNEQWKVLSLQRTIGAMVQERHKITAERDALRTILKDRMRFSDEEIDAALKGGNDGKSRIETETPTE